MNAEGGDFAGILVWLIWHTRKMSPLKFFHTIKSQTCTIIGAFLGYYFLNNVEEYYCKNKVDSSYDIWFRNNKLKRIKTNTGDNKSIKAVIESEVLFKKVSITCLIVLKNEQYERFIQTTWAKGCNEVKFIKIPRRKLSAWKSNLEDSPVMLLSQALHDTIDSDWVLITFDSTFVIVENLRYYLAPLISTDKYYLGHSSKFWNTYFNLGKAGIVLSKGTLRAFQKSVPLSDVTYSSSKKEDFYLGQIFATLGIKPNDTRDISGYSRFHPYNLDIALFGNEDNHKDSFPYKCCSKHSITFKVTSGKSMATYYYLLHKIKRFPQKQIENSLNLQEEDDKVWKNFLKERNISNFNISSEEYYKIWQDLISDPDSFAANMATELYL